MKRYIPLALIAGTLFMGVSAGAGQAAVLSGVGNGISASSHALVTHVGWRHRRCWWRHHHRHCRYWR